MTIKEFVNECELFEHSQENFNFSKLVNETNLLHQYMEAMRFQLSKTGMTLMTENASVMEEGFMFESCTEEALENLEKEFTEKAGEIIKGIKNRVGKIIVRLIGFFKKHILRLKTLGEKQEAARKALQSTTLTEEQADKIKEALNGIGVDIIKAPSVRMKGASLNDDKAMKKLAAAVSQTFTIKVAGSDFSLALGHDQIDSALKSHSDLKRFNASNQKESGGLKYSVHHDQAESVITALEALEKGFEGKSADEDSGKADPGFLSDISKAVSHTVSLYSKVFAFQNNVCGAILAACKAAPAKEEKEPEKEESSEGDE